MPGMREGDRSICPVASEGTHFVLSGLQQQKSKKINLLPRCRYFGKFISQGFYLLWIGGAM
jgi:hypothetical protein